EAFPPPQGGPRPRNCGGPRHMPPATAPRPARRPHPGPALARAFADTRPDLVRALSAFLGNDADAQDAAQDAFLKCWRARARVPAARDLRAWIFRVGFNAARDLRRDGWRRRAVPLGAAAASLADPRPGPPEALAQAEEWARLASAVAGLREEEREAFLRRPEGLAYGALAP